jgi:hypothetical protein
VNDAPIATGAVAAKTVAEDGSVTFSLEELKANTFDAEGDSLRLRSVGAATNGVAVIPDTQPPTIVFTPASNFNGQAGFTFVLSDGNGGELQRSASITFCEYAAAGPRQMARGAAARASACVHTSCWPRASTAWLARSAARVTHMHPHHPIRHSARQRCACAGGRGPEPHRHRGHAADHQQGRPACGRR